MIRTILFTLALFALSLLVNDAELCAQRNVRDSLIFSPHISFNFGYQLPGADMADRFGANGVVGGGFHIKTRSNWYVGAEFSYLFGNDVTEAGLIQNLLTSSQEVISNDGEISEILIQQRGFMVTLNGGKVIPVFGSNRNSGLLLKGGVGLMQHKIRLENQIHTITQLEEEYAKGYDRLTNGLVLSQFAGYFYMGNTRVANFYAGVEAFQGFTRGRRSYTFDTQTVDDQARLDLLFGLRIGWVIHIYKRTERDYYYD